MLGSARLWRRQDEEAGINGGVQLAMNNVYVLLILMMYETWKPHHD